MYEKKLGSRDWERGYCSTGTLPHARDAGGRYSVVIMSLLCHGLTHLRVNETYCSQLVDGKSLLGVGGVAGAPGSGLSGRRSGAEGLAGREGGREAEREGGRSSEFSDSTEILHRILIPFSPTKSLLWRMFLFSPSGPATIIHNSSQYLALMQLISKIISHRPGHLSFPVEYCTKY